MYAYPVALPPFSNREDFLLPVSIFDDDTGQPVNLAGITTASMSGFTGASWTITDGQIVTTSSTSITIPAYPIGNQLSALALTVDVGLGIIPGDAIRISDATGQNTLIGTVTSYTSSTGTLVCQIGMTFQFEIRLGRPNDPGTGYVTWYDFGVQNDRGPLLSAALGSGSNGSILITDLGYLQIEILESQFKKLNLGATYKAALTMFDGYRSRQIFIATLPVLWGGVTN